MLHNCWSTYTLKETCCYNTKRWINPYKGDKRPRSWWEGEGCFPRTTGSLGFLTLPGDSAGVVPRNTVTSTNFTEMEWDEEENRISTAGADVSGWRLLPMTIQIRYLGPHGNSGLHPQRHNSFVIFKELSLQTRPKQRPGHSESLHTSSVAFLPRSGMLNHSTLATPSSWISRLGPAGFPLQPS